MLILYHQEMFGSHCSIHSIFYLVLYVRDIVQANYVFPFLYVRANLPPYVEDEIV
jgi:hypothetical protein